MLFAHKALDPLGVGDTAVLVDIGEADFGAGLFLLGELPEGPSGAYLPAEGAIVLTIANVEVEPGGPYPLQPCLKQSRLQAVGETDLHALPASHAPTQELILRQGTRRADQLSLSPLGEGIGSDEGWDEDPGDKGCDQPAPGQIDSGYLFRFQGSEAEPHRILRTILLALTAHHALRLFPRPFQVHCRAGAALLYTDVTGGTSLAHRSLQGTDSRDKPQQAPQGAEDGAPKAAPIEISEEDGGEDEADEHPLIEEGLAEDQDKAFQKGIESLGNIRDDGDIGAVEEVENGMRHQVHRRLGSHCQGADQQGDGVREASYLQGKEGADEDKDEDVILELARPVPHVLLPSFLGGEVPHEVVQRPQGAGPATEDPAEHEGEGDGDEGQQEGCGHDMRGEEGRDEDQGIEVEEDTDGIGDLIRPFVGRQDEKAEEECQKGPLADTSQPPPRDPSGLSFALALRNWS